LLGKARLPLSCDTHGEIRVVDDGVSIRIDPIHLEEEIFFLEVYPFDLHNSLDAALLVTPLFLEAHVVPTRDGDISSFKVLPWISVVSTSKQRPPESRRPCSTGEKKIERVRQVRENVSDLVIR
jgi:hypothetical protein